MDTIPGIDTRTAQMLIAEIGPDMCVFPTADHLASWGEEVPGPERVRRQAHVRQTPKRPKWLATPSRPRPWPRSEPKTPTCKPATTDSNRDADMEARSATVKHKIITAICHILTTGEPYNELGDEFFRKRDPERRTYRLVTQLERLGHQVTLEPLPEAG